MARETKKIFHDGKGNAVFNVMSLAGIGVRFQMDEVPEWSVENWTPEAKTRTEIKFKDNVCCLHFGPVSMYAVYV